MAYSLSFSPEFYFAADETEREPARNAKGNPISLYGAIMGMPKREFRRACRSHGIDPDCSDSAVELVDKAKTVVDTCANISTPVEVYLTEDRDISVLVYDGPEVEPSEPSGPDYSDRDPKGWCGDPKRGAAMGRGSYHADDKSQPVKLYLRRVRLDNGGYDVNGTYFGHGEPLYWVASEDSEVDFMLRAHDRKRAKEHVRTQYPQARFFN